MSKKSLCRTKMEGIYTGVKRVRSCGKGEHIRGKCGYANCIGNPNIWVDSVDFWMRDRTLMGGNHKGYWFRLLLEMLQIFSFRKNGR